MGHPSSGSSSKLGIAVNIVCRGYDQCPMSGTHSEVPFDRLTEMGHDSDPHIVSRCCVLIRSAVPFPCRVEDIFFWVFYRARPLKRQGHGATRIRPGTAAPSHQTARTANR